MKIAAAFCFCLIAASPALAQPAESVAEAPGPNGPLRGTMILPKPGAPMVLIIPGSGPTDRDGNNPAGLKASTYRLLAEGLAGYGIATVRIDKRGLFTSAAAIPDPNQVTIADYAADVHGWAKAIRQKTGEPCIWVLGHSEGGLVALAAAQDGTDICGLILVSAPGRKLGDILREQLNANPANAPLLPPAMAAIDTLEAGKHVDVTAMPAPLLALFRPQVQDFLINELSYDPAKLIAAYNGPVLILQGDKDIQVSLADAQRLKAADAGAELNEIHNVNHVLKIVTDDSRAANLATYTDPSLPLAPGIADAISDFVRRHVK